MSSVFRPTVSIGHYINKWWVIAVLMMVGGFTGELLSSFRSPVYAATSTITTSIDFGRTGILSDVEEDQIMGIAGDLIQSEDIILALFNTSGNMEDDLSLQENRKKLVAERNHSNWVLRVLDEDPQKAAKIANDWVGLAYEALLDARSHAIRANALLDYQDSLVFCIERIAVFEPVHTGCSYKDWQDLNEQIKLVSDEIALEKELSRGVSPALEFIISGQAWIPNKPVRNNKGGDIFSGALIGFLAAILILEIGWAGNHNTKGKSID
jgi:hypothetical protein